MFITCQPYFHDTSVLIGIFAVCAVLHNYVNLNIGLKLALGQAVAAADFRRA